MRYQTGSNSASAFSIFKFSRCYFPGFEVISLAKTHQQSQLASNHLAWFCAALLILATLTPAFLRQVFSNFLRLVELFDMLPIRLIIMRPVQIHQFTMQQILIYMFDRRIYVARQSRQYDHSIRRKLCVFLLGYLYR